MSNVIVIWLREPWRAGDLVLMGAVWVLPLGRPHPVGWPLTPPGSLPSSPPMKFCCWSPVSPAGSPLSTGGGGGPEKWLSLATTHCLLATLLRKGHTLSWFLPSLLWRQGHLLSSGESPNSWGHLSFNPKRQHKVERGHYEFPWGLADMWLGIKDQSPFLKTTSVSLSGSKGSPL